MLTREAVFYNRFGQLIYREPLGRDAGYDASAVLDPSRTLHDVLHRAVTSASARTPCDRLARAPASSRTRAASSRISTTLAAGARPTQRGDALVACDGLHSVVRRQLHPDEGAAAVFGREHVARRDRCGRRILTGASMIRAGWLATARW